MTDAHADAHAEGMADGLKHAAQVATHHGDKKGITLAAWLLALSYLARRGEMLPAPDREVQELPRRKRRAV